MKKRLPIPLYFGYLTIIQTDDIISEVKKYGEVLDCPRCAVTIKKVVSNQDEHILIFLNDADPSVIAHECIHVKNAIFQEVMITLDTVNDEPEAYLMGWLVEQCHKYLNTRKSNPTR